MKWNKISLVAAGAVFLLGSCTRHSGEPVGRAVLFNNKSNVDTDAFDFYKTVHGTAAYEIGLAGEMSSKATSAQVRELAGKVVEIYESVLPELEELASSEHVLLPASGTVRWEPTETDTTAGDSLQVAATQQTDAITEQNYVAHVKHEQERILTQFNRAARNTNTHMRAYAAEKLPLIQELYTLAGGEAGHGAHH